MVEIITGWINDLSPETHIVLDEEIKTDNFYIKHLIMNNVIVNANYSIKENDDGNLELYLKAMRFRPKCKEFVKKVENKNYITHIGEDEYLTTRCLVNGIKIIDDNEVSIKFVQTLKKKEEKELGIKIDIKILNDGFAFIFKKNINEEPSNGRKWRHSRWYDKYLKSSDLEWNEE
jgi:hypothetical protein